jgi:bifunctional lysine-specific demethylase and histidyl-hydroxylase NO66
VRLTELLQPLGEEPFFAAHWDRAPLLLEGAPDRFTALYSVRQLESQLTETDIHYPQLQLALGGRLLPVTSFTMRRLLSGHADDRLVDVPAVYRLWKDGATIILQSLQTNTPGLIGFLHGLEEDLGHRLMANAYLTPPDSQGFSAHYDTHDVFILQVEGTKHWRIWQQPIPRKPLKDEHPGERVEPVGPVFFAGCLKPGSLVYIPRGHYHEARSDRDTSLHLSIGVPVYRKLDVVRHIFDEILSALENGDPVWRDALAPRFAAHGDPTFGPLRDEVLDRLRQHWNLRATVNRLLEDRRPGNLQLLSQSRSPEEVTQQTLLCLADQAHPRFRVEGDVLQLLWAGQMLMLPAACLELLESLIQRKQFAPGQIAGYSQDTVLALCRHLVREGFLRMSDQTSAIQ